MRPHKHRCLSRFHEGKRVREHYTDFCTDNYESTCIPCDDDELTAAGAAWEYHDNSPSDADPGL